MDDELEAIKQKQMQEMLRRQQRAAEPPVAELDNASFDAFLSANPLVIVDFWAEWCGPCKMMHPTFEAAAREINNARFARINVDKVQQIAARYEVQSIPTFIIFKKGKQVGRITGAVGLADLRLAVSKHASKEMQRR